MPHRAAFLRSRRQAEVIQAGELARIERRRARALSVPLWEVSELAQEHERLDRVQAGRIAAKLRVIGRGLSMLTEGAHAHCPAFVSGGQRSSVAHRPEVLGGVKAKSRHVACGPRSQ